MDFNIKKKLFNKNSLKRINEKKQMTESNFHDFFTILKIIEF